MSMSTVDQAFVAQDTTSDDRPQGSDTVDNTYVTNRSQVQVPVLKDETPVEQPNDEGNPDSDARLEQDEAEAIDSGNILKGDRSRHAKPAGKYTEPGDEEGLPGDDGTSSTRG